MITPLLVGVLGLGGSQSASSNTQVLTIDPQKPDWENAVKLLQLNDDWTGSGFPFRKSCKWGVSAEGVMCQAETKSAHAAAAPRPQNRGRVVVALQT